MTLTKICGKDSQAVSQRCFYGKLFLKYETMHAEYAYFMNSLTFEHLTGRDCFWRHIHCTEMKFSIKAFLSKCDQIRNFLRIWSHLLKKALMRNFIVCAVKYSKISKNIFWPANRVWNNLLRKDDDIFCMVDRLDIIAVYIYEPLLFQVFVP